MYTLRSILEAPPTADLWDGQTDEEELGMSYDFVELYTEYLVRTSSIHKLHKIKIAV